jgi:hypothetical protein
LIFAGAEKLDQIDLPAGMHTADRIFSQERITVTLRPRRRYPRRSSFRCRAIQMTDWLEPGAYFKAWIRIVERGDRKIAGVGQIAAAISPAQVATVQALAKASPPTANPLFGSHHWATGLALRLTQIKAAHRSTRMH